MAQTQRQLVVIDLTLSDDDEAPAPSRVPMDDPTGGTHWQGAIPPAAPQNTIRQAISNSSSNITNSNMNYSVPFHLNGNRPATPLGNMNHPSAMPLYQNLGFMQLSQPAPMLPRLHTPVIPKKKRYKQQQLPSNYAAQIDGANDTPNVDPNQASTSEHQMGATGKRNAVDEVPGDIAKDAKRTKVFNSAKQAGTEKAEARAVGQSEIIDLSSPISRRRRWPSNSSFISGSVQSPSKSQSRTKSIATNGVASRFASSPAKPSSESTGTNGTSKTRSVPEPKSSVKSTPSSSIAASSVTVVAKATILSRSKLAAHIEANILRMKADSEGQRPWLNRGRMQKVEDWASRIPESDLGTFAPSTIISIPFDSEEIELMKREMKAWYNSASPEKVQLARSKKDVWIMRELAGFIHARANIYFHGDCGRPPAAYVRYIRSIHSHSKFMAQPSKRVEGKATALVLRRGKSESSHTIYDTRLQDLLRSRSMGTSSFERVQHSIESVALTKLDGCYERRGMFMNGSGDFVGVQWLSKDIFFATALATSDVTNQEYNNQGNLVIASYDTKVAQSVPWHRTVKSGYVEGVGRPDDKWLYHSVTACAVLTPQTVTEGHPFEITLCFTASFDKNVKIWHPASDGSSMTEVGKWKHGDRCNFATTSEFHDKVATGADVRRNAVRVYDLDNMPGYMEFSGTPYDQYSLRMMSPRTNTEDSWAYFPSAMKWGKCKEVAHYLLVGFTPRGVDDEGDYGVPQHKKDTGQLCVWDTSTGQEVSIRGAKSQNVYEVAWHPTQPFFIAATSAKQPHDFGINTQIHIFGFPNTLGPDEEPYFSLYHTLNCEAIDINEITIMPYHNCYSYITASCTNRKTYIWDSARFDDDPIHTLEHGESVDELPEGVPTEEVDVGVKFCAWGRSYTRLYTGSSDGAVKLWDLTQPQGKQFIKNMVQVPGGVSGGAFSDDRSRLVIGDGMGNLHCLEIFEEDELDDVPQTRPPMFRELIRYHKEQSELDALRQHGEGNGGDDARQAAQKLLDRGLEIHRHKIIGVCQGPHYVPRRRAPSPVNEEDFEISDDPEELERREQKAVAKAANKAWLADCKDQARKRHRKINNPVPNVLPRLQTAKALDYKKFLPCINSLFFSTPDAQKQNMAINCAMLGMGVGDIYAMVGESFNISIKEIIKLLQSRNAVIDGFEAEADSEDEVEAIPTHEVEPEEPEHHLGTYLHISISIIHRPHANFTTDSDEIQEFADVFRKLKMTAPELAINAGLKSLLDSFEAN